ncbi:putative nucleic acid-binding protein [Saccharopolyspora lacisalsi]|uniref:Ribonuclease VapC n=1 Tax=Halosaccharopolyspora lacisalsi TaxID=1000566 RepID=A0A839DL79_9PSEU|nr:PIN domain-containing protein [Halosaccharopolyspora lacisalsi]MBA8822677.1 putative nucleic acid-binding protein [Halosaccharopolyspora lacisalsi]MBA8822693.1 putative nucleic acid-binding protein [Halosaccharopolyspora lacisalsi]MBA8822702.1 putative nucleic acid-binding protein [Halosaccharopolyspora lacisalsi]
MERVILDTGVLIVGEGDHGRFETLLDGIEDVAIAGVTVAEFLTGVLRADTSHRAALRKRWLRGIVERAPVLEYGYTTGEAHAHLLDHVRVAGRPRGRHDLIIAAHARETGRGVLTTDRKGRFGDLPGVIEVER